LKSQTCLKPGWLTDIVPVNCGQDASGYIHGGVNVGLGCNGDTVTRCIDQNVGISGNTDYQCREVS
jgi:hypothetical protein